MKYLLISFLLPSLSYASICGSLLKKDLILHQDLDCSHIVGNISAITIDHPGVTIDGNGYKIIAPKADTVIRVLKNHATIQNVDLTGDGTGRGIEIFNAEDVSIHNNIINSHAIGVDVYMDQTCGKTRIDHNEIRRSAKLGIRINAPACSRAFHIYGNDLSDANGYAVYLKAKKVIIDGSKGNRVDHSRNGLFVSGKKVVIRNLNFAPAEILENPLFISQSKKVEVDNVIVSSIHPGVGLHIYDAKKVYLNRVVSFGHDTGIKVAGEKENLKLLQITQSHVGNSARYGLFLTNYAGAELEKLDISFSRMSRNKVPYYALMPVKKIVTENIDFEIPQ